ncbi:type I secretion system permease/ATPase [Sphingomonas profundi]|uniref:type I secretion system permease/ATPase n=1 Tax=Alterirhizorhabdus profundi TaxID=2681549 RepID=UPI0018D0BF0B|nr:type I secretion system permease/ATPase [Sphingomonas profundi]
MVFGTGRASPLKEALTQYRATFGTVILLSAVLNVLLLGGSIYMMLVYDSVLPSHSLPTLFSLLGLVALVYAFQALFDTMRSRIMNDVGGALSRSLALRVQDLMSEVALRGSRLGGDGLTPMRDLDLVRGFLSGPGPATLIDLPWMLLFLAILSLLHIWLGVAATAGALVMIALTVVTDRAVRAPTQDMAVITGRRNALAESNLRHVEILSALGMRNRMRGRWNEVDHAHLEAQSRLARAVGLYGGASKVFRMFLQSAILTVGALLVIDGKASGGVIFASSLLSGRALAPIDTAIANWRSFAAARAAWRRLDELLSRAPRPADLAVELPAPSRDVTVSQLAVAPPGTQRLTVRNVQFQLAAGDALGIIGPSGAGKTSLVRALLGVWPAARGAIRLDGATLDQRDPERLGAATGYLPQMVELLDGTVAQNIARFDAAAASEDVIAAARAAAVHDLIVALPQGYDTPVGNDGAELSAGQRQRIGLARALFRDPFLVVLDEPNSNLDAVGEAALESAVAAVRSRGGIVVLVAHRQSTLSHVSHLLFMRDGEQEAFGTRDEVLGKVLAKPAARNPAATPQRAAGGAR